MTPHNFLFLTTPSNYQWIAELAQFRLLPYDTDGTSTTTLPTPIDVIAGGMTTGAALGLPEGSYCTERHSAHEYRRTGKSQYRTSK